LSRLAGNEIGFLRDQGIQLRDHVAGRLIIDEAEAQEDREHNHAKYLKGPLENRPSHETGPAHGAASCPRRLIISGPQGCWTQLRNDLTIMKWGEHPQTFTKVAFDEGPILALSRHADWLGGCLFPGGADRKCRYVDGQGSF